MYAKSITALTSGIARNAAATHAAINMLFDFFNRTSREYRELHRRMTAGIIWKLLMQQDYGALAWTAKITGMSPHTIRRGWQDLRSGDLLLRSERPRGRRPGGGRKLKLRGK